jgi:hypothetical protein
MENSTLEKRRTPNHHSDNEPEVEYYYSMEIHSMLEKTPQIQKYVEAPQPDDSKTNCDRDKDSRRVVRP